MFNVSIPFFSWKEVVGGFKNGDSYGDSKIYVGFSRFFSDLLCFIAWVYRFFNKNK